MSDEKSNKLNVSININTILTLACGTIVSLLLWANKQQLEANHQDTIIQVQTLQAYGDKTYCTKDEHNRDVTDIKNWIERLAQKNNNNKVIDR